MVHVGFLCLHYFVDIHIKFNNEFYLFYFTLSLRSLSTKTKNKLYKYYGYIFKTLHVQSLKYLQVDKSFFILTGYYIHTDSK